MTDTDVAIIGAGPHGLAAAAHLRRAGVATHIFGEPMSFWQGMPAGLLLRTKARSRSTRFAPSAAAAGGCPSRWTGSSTTAPGCRAR
jgi:cation diffusion facilitator CzcD-associated flavoprotein CzcO